MLGQHSVFSKLCVIKECVFFCLCPPWLVYGLPGTAEYGQTVKIELLRFRKSACVSGATATAFGLLSSKVGSLKCLQTFSWVPAYMYSY